MAVEFYINMIQSLLVSARRQVPAQIRILWQELPEMEDQLAVVADGGAFTGIKRLHCMVKM